ncbi:MAG: aspartate aminotransferase family protein [Firmicutes bacterium]|nr:aspartate aminotransferase family protein [Bacillota bacterium]
MDLMNTYKQYPYKMIKGEGNYLIDENGKRYLDFLSGIAVNPLGYGNKKIENAIIEQAKNLIHASNYFYTKTPLALAKLLVDNTCFDKVFFANSGAEANEGAIKLARKYSELKYSIDRNVIISFTNSFHGRTLATLTATGQDSFHQHFFPLPDGFKYCPFGDIKALESMLDDNICAIIIEPIQGEGGINIAEKDFLFEMKKLAEKKDILLIFDEVQTGIGRTGNLFAYQGIGIEPDILTSAKALGGGLPLGAFMAKEKVANALVPGDHGSTFGGNPVACASGCAVLETILEPGFLDSMNKVAGYFKGELLKLVEKYSVIKEFRGKGLMCGLELNIDGADFVKAAFEKGLIINCTNVRVLRFLPPLTIKKEEIDILIEFLDGELKKRSVA